VGMRNIRDYKGLIRAESQTMGSASPFNVVTEALTMHFFTLEEVQELYAQHTAQTGQPFAEGVVERVYWWTSGQPWLVNAVARECVEKLRPVKGYPGWDLYLAEKGEEPPGDGTVTVDMAETAVKNIILRRDVHIDSLLERLHEKRVQRVIEPVLLGDETDIDYLDDDFAYCMDLGLIKFEDGRLVPGNRIYSEVFVRMLTFNTQFALQSSLDPPWATEDGLDMDGLLKGFQEFWRENSDIWLGKYQYREAAPQLILQAFLQRVLNGGGELVRELATGTRRIDLCVRYAGRKYPLELKVLRRKDTVEKGTVQLGAYMDTLGEREGWLVVFDPDNDKPWAERIFWRNEQTEHGLVHIVGC